MNQHFLLRMQGNLINDFFFYRKDFDLFQGQGTSVHKLQKWENNAKIDKKKKIK